MPTKSFWGREFSLLTLRRRFDGAVSTPTNSSHKMNHSQAVPHFPPKPGPFCSLAPPSFFHCRLPVFFLPRALGSTSVLIPGVRWMGFGGRSLGQKHNQKKKKTKKEPKIPPFPRVTLSVLAMGSWAPGRLLKF